jgi:hypothetical protein
MERCYFFDIIPTSGYTPLSTWYEIQICGNGFIKGYEECDCPNNDYTNYDNCCDGLTCKLKSI